MIRYLRRVLGGWLTTDDETDDETETVTGATVAEATDETVVYVSTNTRTGPQIFHRTPECHHLERATDVKTIERGALFDDAQVCDHCSDGYRRGVSPDDQD